MASSLDSVFTIGHSDDKIPLICPETKVFLKKEGNKLVPSESAEDATAKKWGFEEGFIDVVVGDRFNDETDQECRCYEVTSNEYSTKHYWIPLFKDLFKKEIAEGKRPRLLSVGCGIGVEVDLLCEAGFNCFGVDNGNRTKDWPTRKNNEGLLLANAMHLPFEDDTFDAVFCGCVFPHVGVVGDSNQTHEETEAHRQKLASEMVRVQKKGGFCVACSPNRLFPFDIFHGRKKGSYIPRFNPPTSHFLLSVSDYRKMFKSGGCESVRALPVKGFWGFVTMSQSIKGKILSAPIRLAFAAASSAKLSFLRNSPFVPWVAVAGRKA